MNASWWSAVLVTAGVTAVLAEPSVRVRVSQRRASALDPVLVTVMVDPDADNRELRVQVSSEQYYRRSDIDLHGDRAALTHRFRYEGLPAGEYAVQMWSSTTGASRLPQSTRSRGWTCAEAFTIARPTGVDMSRIIANLESSAPNEQPSIVNPQSPVDDNPQSSINRQSVNKKGRNLPVPPSWNSRSVRRQNTNRAPKRIWRGAWYPASAVLGSTGCPKSGFADWNVTCVV